MKRLPVLLLIVIMPGITGAAAASPASLQNGIIAGNGAVCSFDPADPFGIGFDPFNPDRLSSSPPRLFL
jgi:hypothetical protein